MEVKFDTMKRETLIVGNWKMFKTHGEAEVYVEKLSALLDDTEGAMLAVPFTCLEAASRGKFTIGAQNISEFLEGAYTGEISAAMAKASGAKFTLIGHSERRHLFHESDGVTELKVMQALAHGLRPILCIGESQDERDADKTDKVLERQLHAALSSFSKEQLKDIVIAYEPVWAIGTGRTASPGMAQEAHSHCRSVLTHLFGEELAEQMPILYGGSVKIETIKALIQEKDIDGALVGGASLDPEGFSQIIKLAKES
ncbi:MAG: Triosephosphate isomerase [Chlamydiia bacterium]|nr:Triosephosphate isomerase [Chlamydiia bacterium]MCH9615811.1 Triosephosphate isomerase [Chlamydiia bacterium]MCH9628786.1 Triosephosphate isomerase [Chlamydiia bacterium]